MKNTIDTVSAINSIIREELWFDMELAGLSGNTVTLVGGIDLTTHHTLEITFHGVFHLCLNAHWRTDVSESPLILLPAGAEAKALNIKYEVEAGHQIFKIKPEGFAEDACFFVIAEDVSYDNTTVYYYRKEDLKEGEKIAPWVA